MIIGKLFLAAVAVLGAAFFFTSSASAAEDVTPEQLKAMIEKKEPMELIDVRTPAEYEEGHIPGSRLVPLDAIKGNTDNLPKDLKNAVILCRSGRRSRTAIDILEKRGMTGIKHLSVGFSGWESSGGKVEKGRAK